MLTALSVGLAVGLSKTSTTTSAGNSKFALLA